MIPLGLVLVLCVITWVIGCAFWDALYYNLGPWPGLILPFIFIGDCLNKLAQRRSYKQIEKAARWCAKCGHHAGLRPPWLISCGMRGGTCLCLHDHPERTALGLYLMPEAKA